MRPHTQKKDALIKQKQNVTHKQKPKNATHLIIVKNKIVAKKVTDLMTTYRCILIFSLPFRETWFYSIKTIQLTNLTNSVLANLLHLVNITWLHTRACKCNVSTFGTYFGCEEIKRTYLDLT